VGFELPTLVFCSAAVLLRTSPKPDLETSILPMTELDLLKKPEYIHVVLNHLPIYGTMLGALALAISLILRSRTAQITALILTLIAAALTLVVAILCSGIAVYIAQPGGRVRHPEFRTSDTPAPSTEMNHDK
jgi:hypothetical protein